MSEHTKEPWASYVAEFDGVECVAVAKDCKIYGETSAAICVITETSKMNQEDIANARRIVACVNACAGISTEELERGVIKESMDMVDRLSREITALATDCAGQNCHACANPCEKYIESLR